MSTFLMTYRAANGLRVVRELQAATVAAAWDCAFDLAAECGRVCGFGLSRAAA